MMANQTLGRRVALLVGVLGLVATVIAGALTFVTRDTRQDIDLAEFAHASTDLAALAGYTDDTNDLCRDAPGCIQGFHAAYADYRKFASEEDANAFASSSPDSHLSSWIVIEYTDDTLTEVDRQEIQQMIDSTAISE